jgi:excisionase family DNA binding protein
MPTTTRPKEKHVSKDKYPNIQLPSLLTIQQVATFIQFSTRQVRRWIESGELKATQFGRSWRIAENDLALFLATFKRK